MDVLLQANDTGSGTDESAVTGCHISANNVVALATSGLRQWTIKGIPSDTVEVSREAARRSGMKLNSWVGSALQRAAESHTGSADASRLEVTRRVEELEDYLKTEFETLRMKSDQIESTINSISAILLKLSVKGDLI